MWPIFILAAVLVGCGSSSSDSNPPPPPPPKDSASSEPEDAGTPEPAPSASAAPAPSASASASAPPPVDSSDPFSDPPTSVSPFPPCENKSDDLWKSNFTTTFVDQERFKQIISGGTFCTREKIRLSAIGCQDAHQFFPLILDPNSNNRHMIRFNLEAILGATDKCPSMLTMKEINCHPTIAGVNNMLTCDDKSLLTQPYLLGTRVTLDNLLQGDGNSDGAQDLLLQLSNGTGFYFAQTPTYNGGGEAPEWQPPEQ